MTEFAVTVKGLYDTIVVADDHDTACDRAIEEFLEITDEANGVLVMIDSVKEVV